MGRANMDTPGDSSLVGGAGDPFATVQPAPGAAGALPVGGATPTPGAGAAAPPQYVTVEQYQAQQTELDRLKKRDESIGWVGDALSDPAVRARITALIAGQGPGAAPQANPLPDQAEAIRGKYRQRMQDALASGDMIGYGNAISEMTSEVDELKFNARMQTAAGPVLSTTATTAIESFFNNKRNDPRTAKIFPKVEGKLREMIARTTPGQMALMVSNGSLFNTLESAFKVALADTYIDAYSAADAAGKLGSSTPAVPPYARGTGGGSPDVLQGDDLPGKDEEDDKQFLKDLEAAGLKVKFSGNASGTKITAELE